MTSGETAWRRLARPQGTGRFTAGDPLRGLGTLAVLVYHAAYGAIAFVPPGLGQGLAAFGALGFFVTPLELAVPMFFALSAFLIGRPYVHALILGEPLPATRAYARNRLLRIVPAFYAIYAVILLRWGVGPGGSPLDALAVFGFAQTYHYTAAAGPIGQAWTLDVEIAFYVLVPFVALLAARLVRRLSPWQRLVGVVALLAAGLMASVYARAHGPDGAFAGLGWLGSPPAMFCSFAPGLLLAAIEIPLVPVLRARPGVGRALTWLLGIACVLATLIYSALGSTLGAPALLQDLTGKRVLFEVAATGLLVAALLVRQWSGRGCPRVLDNAPAHWLGERSLSFYLLHFAVLIELNGLVGGQHSVWAAWAIYLAAAVPLTALGAAIVHRFVEKPFLARKHRALTAPQPRTAAGVPGAVPAPAPAAT